MRRGFALGCLGWLILLVLVGLVGWAVAGHSLEYWMGYAAVFLVPAGAVVALIALVVLLVRRRRTPRIAR